MQVMKVMIFKERSICKQQDRVRLKNMLMKKLGTLSLLVLLFVQIKSASVSLSVFMVSGYVQNYYTTFLCKT